MAKKEKFNYFDSFIKQTEIAVDMSELLIDSIRNFKTAGELAEPMQKAHDLEHSGDEINHLILNNIQRDFITPIDRQDLLNLSQNLDNIIDELEDVLQLFYMYDIHEMDKDCEEFVGLIRKSCKALNKLAIAFKNFKKNKDEIKKCIIEVNNCEEEADMMYIDVIRKHYVADKKSPMRVVIWTRIYDRMEKCCDACEHAADVISSAVLQNS